MRFTPTFGKVALATAMVLVAGIAVLAPSASAQAVDGITGAALTGAKVAIPVSATPTVTNLSLTFAGPVDPNTTYTATAKMKVVKSAVKKRKLPTVVIPASLTPNTPNMIQLSTSSVTSRGDYQVTVVISKRVSGVVTASATVKAKIVLYHSAANSASLATFRVYYYSANRSKLKIVATVPSYLAGAKVKVLFALPKDSAFKAIGSGKVNGLGHFTIKTKKVKLGPDFYVAISVKSRPHAEAFAKIGRFYI